MGPAVAGTVGQRLLLLPGTIVGRGEEPGGGSRARPAPLLVVQRGPDQRHRPTRPDLGRRHPERPDGHRPEQLHGEAAHSPLAMIREVLDGPAEQRRGWSAVLAVGAPRARRRRLGEEAVGAVLDVEGGHR